MQVYVRKPAWLLAVDRRTLCLLGDRARAAVPLTIRPARARDHARARRSNRHRQACRIAPGCTIASGPLWTPMRPCDRRLAAVFTFTRSNMNTSKGRQALDRGARAQSIRFEIPAAMGPLPNGPGARWGWGANAILARARSCPIPPASPVRNIFCT